MMMTQRQVEIPIHRDIALSGDWIFPSGFEALIIFAHGSGSSRKSPRNQRVASFLQRAKMSTLLIDLLTEEEDRVYENRFNIDLLTNRLVRVTHYMQQMKEMQGIPIGYFGASTGAASALRAAALLPDVIFAVVSRGGRPDLATGSLGKVKAPTLFIVGSRDQDVLMLNRKAMSVLPFEKKLELVEGASHLFEEPGALDIVSELAANWFSQHRVSTISSKTHDHDI